jgi:EAL domain-containing protein (putative c-di-GMP-specific phosphodiesterase class I)
MNPEYVKKVKKILKKYNIPKDMIELELTETVFLDEREKMISVMRELKSHDLILDIDDFGSGYSSLNLLKDVPFDILKIDREFFSETSTSETSMLILRKIVEMADGLGVSCICEGVETKEQEIFLKEIGCRYAQGYLYSKPMPSKEFIDKYVSK